VVVVGILPVTNALGGEKITLTVKGPRMTEIQSFYGIIGDTAVIEMAAAAGLHLAGTPVDPSAATTYGVGQLISDAIDKGCGNIILGLGGSCTNDGGVGAAAALGARFLDSGGKEFLPTGGTLSKISSIDLGILNRRLRGISVTAICDIDNPVYGTNGAAYIFAPQKGADAEMVFLLDENLRAYAEAIRRSLGIDVSGLKGGGAAGAMGAGVYAFFGALLKPGIEVVLDFIHFDELLEGCDYVFTGEGKLDRQSLGGKVVVGIGRRARERKVPVIAVVGFAEDGLNEIYDQGITRVFPCTDKIMPLENLKLRCRDDLSLAMDQVTAALKQDEENNK
jgi:glycerate kinase